MFSMRINGGSVRRAAIAAAAVVLSAPIWTGDALHAQEPDTTITIHTTGSNLEFSPARIAAREGTRVRIRYVNEGTLPHNVVLVKDEADIDMLGLAAFQAGGTDYIPVQHEERMIAYTKLAVPGETVEMTFTVPPAGEYFFVCLYAGHYNMMVGTLRSLKP
jgi:plastocyanin